MNSRIFTSALAVGLICLSGCARRDMGEVSQISVRMPEAVQDSTKTKIAARSKSSWAEALKVHAQGASSLPWGLVDPTTLTQFSCYAVFVGAPDSGFNTSSCQSADGAQTFSFGPMAGLVARGQVATLENVKSGANRTITVMGFALESGQACESLLSSSGLTFGRYSAPFIIGQTTQNLASGDVGVTIQTALPGVKIGTCQMFGGLQVLARLTSAGQILNDSGASFPVDRSQPYLDSIFHDSGAGASSILGTQNQCGGVLASGVDIQVPAYVKSVTKRPESSQYFGFLEGGEIVGVNPSTGAVTSFAACPISSCAAPVWMQSISVDSKGIVMGLDHGGNVYKITGGGTTLSKVAHVEPSVHQIVVY